MRAVIGIILDSGSFEVSSGWRCFLFIEFCATTEALFLFFPFRGASNMECNGNEGGVPLSMIPLLEVAYSKCQEEEKDSVQEQVQKGAWLARQEQEEAGKKRKRSSNWSEAETLQLLLLRKGQLQNKEERKSCPKGSIAWDEIASQLKEKFTPRSGKHVGERWDTLRRVYMDIEEHCSKTQETYAEVLDANRDSFKFIPTEYTQKWHELIADCKPGKRRGKKLNESGSIPQKVVTSLPSVRAAPSRTEPAVGNYSNIAPLETCPDGNLTQSRLDRAPADAAHTEFVPSESSPTSVAQPSGIASAFGTLIKDIERILSCQKNQDTSGQICWKKCAKMTGDSDHRAEANGVELADEMRCDAKVNVVGSLQSVLAALKSASEFTNSGKSFSILWAKLCFVLSLFYIVQPGFKKLTSVLYYRVLPSKN